MARTTLGKVLLGAALAIGAVGVSLPALSPAAMAQEEQFKQVQLTEALVKAFIAAQKDVTDLAQKTGPQQTDTPDPKVQAELEAIAKKHGFATFTDFDDVAYNISLVLGGLDPQTGAFTDPVTAIKREIADVNADATIPAADKKQMLDELNEALKSTPPLKYPGNIEVVKKHREELEKVLQ